MYVFIIYEENSLLFISIIPIPIFIILVGMQIHFKTSLTLTPISAKRQVGTFSSIKHGHEVQTIEDYVNIWPVYWMKCGQYIETLSHAIVVHLGISFNNTESLLRGLGIKSWRLFFPHKYISVLVFLIVLNYFPKMSY